MTIREAVELYNGIQDKISTIRNIIRGIANRQLDPMGYYSVHRTEMEDIVVYLKEYSEKLEKMLDKEFN